MQTYSISGAAGKSCTMMLNPKTVSGANDPFGATLPTVTSSDTTIATCSAVIALNGGAVHQATISLIAPGSAVLSISGSDIDGDSLTEPIDVTVTAPDPLGTWGATFSSFS